MDSSKYARLINHTPSLMKNAYHALDASLTKNAPFMKNSRAHSMQPLVTDPCGPQPDLSDVVPTDECAEEVSFLWNGRPCAGNSLHEAALNGNYEVAEQLLDSALVDVRSRFTYETHFQGQVQEGSGEAIHLAASRGRTQVVTLLLKYGAQLESMVTRDHKPHYNVLHAAVFAEGRGGRVSMVRLLLEQGALITANANGQWPLHMAFQTGSMELIDFFNTEMNLRGLEQIHCESRQKSSLELGIQMGKMSEQQLADAAPLDPASLHVFINHEQRCIPAFLKRVSASGCWTAALLATHVDGRDIAKVLRENSEAASALLDGLTADPECDSVGWWPLPTRLSFASRGIVEHVRSLVNPPTELLHFYQADTAWRYDLKNFESPTWHRQISDRTRGRPIVDAEIKVCHVPNIVCAELFAALVDADHGDEASIFENLVVRGSISEAWWHGACLVDLAQVLLSIMGLVILVVESSLVVHGHVGFRIVASDFIGAKGVVDLVQELLQCAGYAAMGRGRDYLKLENAFDIVVCMAQISLFHDNGNRIVMVFVIFLYWMRLGNVFLWAETLARALLPIQQIMSSLGPASLVTSVGFCAFTHAFYIVRGKAGVFWAVIIPKTFSTLIALDVPAQSGNEDVLEVVLTYVAVIVFSMFVLNIFIGVIGEQYEVQKARCPIIFQQRRASACLNYLLRAQIVPCALISRNVAFGIQAVAVFSMLTLQAVGLHHGRSVEWNRSCLIVCQLVTILAAYQNPEAPWATGSMGSGGSTDKHHLWLAVPRKRYVASTLDEVHSLMMQLHKALPPSSEELAASTYLKSASKSSTESLFP